MTKLARFSISPLLVVMFALTPSSPLLQAADNLPSNPIVNEKDYKVKNGRDVVARVATLKANNRNVRAALRAFEVKGHPPKLEDSFAITGFKPSQNVAASDNWNASALFERVSFTQQSAISGDGVEMIFIPTVSISAEWQGTVIATRYDGNGNFIDQYVADSVLIMPDPNSYEWNAVYEAPVEGGIVQAPISELGMYTNVELGVPLGDQSQQLMQGPVTKNRKNNLNGSARLANANLVQDRRARVRAWARCSFAWCAGAGITCVGVNLWNAELLAGPCFAIGCGTSMIGCTWGTIWQ